VNWGWKKEQHSFVPVFSADPPAPDTLLKNIFCPCKKGCGNGCGCRKLGIKFIKVIKMRLFSLSYISLFFYFSF